MACARCAASAVTLCELSAKLVDLGPGSGAEAGVEGITGFDLTRVDEEGSRAWQATAILIVVPEQLEMAGMERRALVGLNVATLEARNPLEHQLRDRRVLADDDEYWGHTDASLFPALELAFVVAVECM